MQLMEQPPGTNGFALDATNFDEALTISRTLAASQLVPKDFQGKPENVFVAICWGRELGLAPLQSLQNIAVINGRPGLWGDAALAICQGRPDFAEIEETTEGEGDDLRAVCTVQRKGRVVVRREFSVADAKRAGLWSKAGPWTQYPGRMLQMRARGFALRDCFPDALRGFRLAEELQDIAPERDITPERPPVAMPTSKPATRGRDPDPITITPDETDATEPQAAPAADPLDADLTASAGQMGVIRAALQRAKLTETDLHARFGVDRVAAVPAGQVNEILAWIKGGGA